MAGGGGDAWAELVGLWWQHEKAAGFDGPKKGKNVKMRPEEVKGWVGRARQGGPSPPIGDLYAFITVWWRWWVSINPGWRARKGTPERLERTGEGDWSCLSGETGPNGLLNVLVCLRWWRDLLRGDLDAAGWDDAVSDVLWVLKGLR
ncbi:hypothetical protein C8R43DRAFT_878563 [Mycena crocata]|nr:hypothetical protein C8R43DRAFT_878563 [Mycena crocata]